MPPGSQISCSGTADVANSSNKLAALRTSDGYVVSSNQNGEDIATSGSGSAPFPWPATGGGKTLHVQNWSLSGLNAIDGNQWTVAVCTGSPKSTLDGEIQYEKHARVDVVLEFETSPL
jgi:hypothetical protein